MEEARNVNEKKNNVDVEDLDIDGDNYEEVGPKSKKRSIKEASRSEYWQYFVRFFCEIDKVQKGRCKYCDREIKADPRIHGTRPLKNHFASCKKKPHDVATNQARITIQPSRANEKEGHIGTWKFDQNKIRAALTYWLIVDELPFKTVENKGFKHFMSIACPMFSIPSRRTTTKDVYDMYMNEKRQLMSILKQHTQRICITTDTWTSIQRVNYMCLTAHFIDDEWKLEKRILNFCPITGHKSDDVGKGVEKCLLDWGIDKIFTITVDNASSNDGAITYLQRRFDNWGSNILGGRYLHMRCIAHIVNLIVQDGLKGKDEHSAISRIRGAVRYIRNSPARYKRFGECVELEKIETKKLLSLDVPTRWNSTYLMLESAVSVKRAFYSYADTDLAYVNDLSKPPYDGIPTDYDWERAELLLKFLGHFYKLTLAISGSLYVTSNTVFHEISSVDMLLKEWLNGDDFELREMSRKMKNKFDKYWGSIEKMNMLYYAVILDPRHKLEFIEFSFDAIYDDFTNGFVTKEKVKSGMEELFYEYKVTYGTPGSPAPSSLGSTSFSRSSQSDNLVTSRTYLKDEFRKYKLGGKKERAKTEIEKYLSEDPEDYDENFDILQWWKINSPRFPILSKMARDILAVPVSTVASEAAFSTGGRVLDAFRSSLSPRIVQALVCAQDWLRLDSKPICVEEDLVEIEILEKELTQWGNESTIIDI